MSRNFLKPMTATLLLLTPLLGGCEEQEAASAPPPPPEVSIMTVQTQPAVLSSELPGRIVSARVSDVRPQVSGLIQKRLFEEGTDVEAGQVLYQIDPAPFQARYDSAAANLLSAQKAAEQARAALNASLANVARQEATLKLAETNLKRLEDLFAASAVSESERDQAATDVQVARAALLAAQAQVESDRGAIANAEAAIEQAKAALQSAEIDLDYTKVKAPISGRIGRSNVTEGAIVTAYQPLALATIQQLDPIYVDVPRSTAELLELRRSVESGRLNRDGTNRVRIILENGMEYPHLGTLKFSDVTVDPTTSSVILRIEVPNPDGYLLPGMFARAIVEEGVHQHAILVPQEAITRDPRGVAIALVLDEADTVQQRQLTAERAIGNQWLISDGLNEGDRLIVKGTQRIRPGSPVRIVETLPSTPVEAQAQAPMATPDIH